MGQVASLYRYPVKGFNPEIRDEIVVLDDGRIQGDRVLGFRLADTGLADDEWGPKDGFVDLMNTPGLARLRVSYDELAQHLRIDEGGALFAEADLDEAGRRHLAAAVEEYVLELPSRENPLSDHPERRPLRLIGDGVTSRYQDRVAGYVTLHGRASLDELREAIHDPMLSEVRFRSNIAVDGIAPWEEQGWLEKLLAIGPVQFLVPAPVYRCLATHAGPETGLRDGPVLNTLTRAFAQEAPTFAVLLALTGPGGPIRVGDPLEVHTLI